MLSFSRMTWRTFINNRNNTTHKMSPQRVEILLIFQIVSFIRTNLMMNEKIFICIQKSHVTFIEIYYFHWLTLIDSQRIHNVYLIDYRLIFYFWYIFLFFTTVLKLWFNFLSISFRLRLYVYILYFSYVMLTCLFFKINRTKLEHPVRLQRAK